MKTPKMYFKYDHCELHRVIDGDTVDIEIDLGFHIKTSQRFRLARIDAPEIHGVKKSSVEKRMGLVSKGWLENWFKDHPGFEVEVIKHGKYRWVAEIWCGKENLSDRMVKEGVAVFYGEKKSSSKKGSKGRK